MKRIFFVLIVFTLTVFVAVVNVKGEEVNITYFRTADGDSADINFLRKNFAAGIQLGRVSKIKGNYLGGNGYISLLRSQKLMLLIGGGYTVFETEICKKGQAYELIGKIDYNLSDKIITFLKAEIGYNRYINQDINEKSYIYTLAPGMEVQINSICNLLFQYRILNGNSKDTFNNSVQLEQESIAIGIKFRR